MAAIPAICDECSAVFPSGFAGSGGGTMFVHGCRSGPCPECGAMGSLPDGAYSLEDTLIRFLSGPQSSYEKLAHIAETVRKMQSAGASEEEILQEVSKTSPALAWFGGFFGKPLAPAYFSLLLSVATMIQNCSQPADIEEAVRSGVLGAFMHQNSGDSNASTLDPPLQVPEVPINENKQDNARCGDDNPRSDCEKKEGDDGYRLSDYI